ncbi:MAG: YigZ family protein, partial [Prevotellaceae bacterium]|nr:YigZ family protein [Prevotellaceae bacterium]
DAHHVCYAYILSPQRETYRAADDGEPSGTAGRPILGQINSRQLTDILVIVVRYFGGTKLGTSGLIRAYKTAAAAALSEADIEERKVCDTVTATFEYPLLSQVMRIVKDEETTILRQDFQLQCEMVLQVRQSLTSRLTQRLAQVRGVEIQVND